MKYYKELLLPNFDNTLGTLDKLLEDNIIAWHKNNQICINTIEHEPDNYHLGVGSLIFDWSTPNTIEKNGINKLIVTNKEIQLKETDFTILCSQFKNTVFETIYNTLKKNFDIGRVRIMKSDPRTCLSWHKDSNKRIHYPIKTDIKCKMVVEDEVFHLDKNKWWLIDTTYYHTAFNGSKESRIHIMAELIKEKVNLTI